MGTVKDGDCRTPKTAIVESLVIGYDASISLSHTLFTIIHFQAVTSPTDTKKHVPGLGSFHPT